MIPLASGFDWLLRPTFEHPERLGYLLLIPLGIGLYIVAMLLRKRTGMRYTNTAVLGRVAPPQRRAFRHIAVGMSLLSLVTLTLAYMIPQATDRVPRERATVVVVLDISQSMQATDVAPTRFEAEKKAAGTFITSLPSGYNVALVSLSGNPAVRLPPTTDHQAAVRAVDRLKLQDSTAIGDAIYASLDAIAQAPKGDNGAVAPAAVVLLSDGVNTAGRSPRQAAEAAKKQNVKVYTVAYGTDMGYVDLDGTRYRVPPDKQLLGEIATTTGAQLFAADNASQLDAAYKSLRSEVGYDEVKTEVTARWAGLGLVFGLLAALAAVMMAARWP